jgi:DNA polymerase elongation subunit (family B)
MQRRMLDVMARAKTISELQATQDEINAIYRETVNNLPAADPKEMMINRRINRLTYAHRCIEGAAVQAYRDNKIEIAPGMKIQYVVTDARRYKVEPSWCASSFDVGYYRELIDKAYGEITFAFSQAG